MFRGNPLKLAVAAGLLLFTAGSALASVMSFSIDLNGYDATASLNTSAIPGGNTLLATGGTLDVTAVGSVTVGTALPLGAYSLVSGGPNPFTQGQFTADNVLYPGANPLLDGYGLLFAAASDSTLINITGLYANNYGFYYCVSTVCQSPTGMPTSVSLSAVPNVPEPDTLALFGIGLAAIAAGAALRRRRPG